jgi:hypothetical protein
VSAMENASDVLKRKQRNETKRNCVGLLVKHSVCCRDVKRELHETVMAVTQRSGDGEV